MRKHLLLAGLFMQFFSSFAQKQGVALKHLESAPDRHLVQAIFKKQQSAEQVSKTTATQKRLRATSYIANGIIQDSNRYYYSQGRGSVKNVVSEYYFPLPNNTQQIHSDSSVNWHDDQQNGFQWNHTQKYIYDANNRAVRLDYSSPYYMSGTEAVYNSTGQLTKAVSLDTMGGTALMPKSERMFFYNAQGRYEGDSSYSLTSNQPTGKTEQHYDGAGNLIIYNSYSWLNNNWLLTYQTNYNYDASNRLISRYSQYDFMGTGLVNNIRDTFAYTGTNTTASYTSYYFWSTQNAAWYPVESYLYQFNTQGLVDTYYIRQYVNPGVWDTLERDVYYYDGDDYLLQSKGYLHLGNGVFDAVNYDVQTLYYEEYFPAGVTELEQEEHVVLYPNPVKDKLNIKTKTNTEGNITIINSLGQQVFSGLVKGNEPIDIQHLPPGNYLVRLNDNKGHVVYSGQLMKQ